MTAPAALKIAVLMGGPSGEYEISLRSGRGVAEALARRRWAVEPAVIPQTATIPEACEFAKRVLQRIGPDVAFLALHGPFGEDGAIQQVCEELRVAYTGSTAEASRLGIDKAASKKHFEAAGLRVPRGRTVDLRQTGEDWLDLACPVVVKPVGQGSSLGVSVVRHEAQLPEALAAAGEYGPLVLVEEFIAGRELTVGVFGEEPLPAVEVRPSHAFFDYATKYTAGMTEYLVPAPLSPEIAAIVQAAGLKAHQALGCRHLSRTDLILTADNTPVILEVNTIPGFTPTSLLPKAAACAGISYDELCAQLVLMAQQGAPHAAHHA